MFLLSFLMMGVSGRSREDLSRLGKSQDFVQRSEALEESNDDELLQQIEELDTMIKLARNARSIKEDEEVEDMVAEDEMVRVLDSIDLSSAENVEAVSDVLRTLPGDVQLEFLMNKFMMKDEEVKEEIMSSKTGVSSTKAKRSAYGRQVSHADPEPEYSNYKQFSSSFSEVRSSSVSDGTAEPEPEPSHYSPRFRRSAIDDTERGPQGILLQRSADNHGFSEDLDALSNESGESSEKKGKVMGRLVDMLGKTRKRRSSEEDVQDISSLPRKQPVVNVNVDF